MSLRTSASLKTSKCGHRHNRDMGGDVHPWRRVLEGGELYGSAAPAGRAALRRLSAPQISGVYHGRAQDASLIGVAPRSISGSLAKFTAMRRASSRVRRFGRRAVRRSDTSEIGGEAEVRGLRVKRR